MKCFWLVARRQPKITKIQNVAGISNYYRTKLLKKVLIKNVHLLYIAAQPKEEENVLLQ